MELLKQAQYRPFGVVQQVVSIYTGVKGHLDDIPVKDIRRFEDQFLNFMEEKKKDIMDAIANDKKVSDETEEKLKAAIQEFKGLFK